MKRKDVRWKSRHPRRKNQGVTETYIRKGVLALMVLLGILAFCILTGRLVKLMLVDHDYYEEKAINNQTRSVSVTANRGCIYDRNMEVLAASAGVHNIFLDPLELKQNEVDIDLLAENLAQLLDLEADYIKEQAADTSMRYKVLRRRQDQTVCDAVIAFLDEYNIPGVHLEPESLRYYPNDATASQLLGFTNTENKGSEGLEARYNALLEGSAGAVITTKGNNETEMLYSYETYYEAKDGNSLVLTLDLTVQRALEKQMQDAIDRYDVLNGAFGIVMNAKTGEILAMATLGGYDPNSYLEIYDEEKNEALEELYLKALSYPEGSEERTQAFATYNEAMATARLKQWRNRCVSDGYEPGSTFKVLTLAAALDSGAVTLDDHFYCGGRETFEGRSQPVNCWQSKGHGSETTAEALQNSCNLAFAHIALKLGGERFYEYVERFGILRKTGIDLAGESKGVFFDKALVTDTDKWGTASLTSGSFGQTFKLTPLQLVTAIASVVNGGNLMEPYLVSEVIDADGNTVLKQEPTVVGQTVSPETSKTMCALMESVVAVGTAKNASVAGYSIGGKTGTSEKIDVFDENGQRVLDKIVSFVGVAPMDDPRYIVLVALDTPSRTTGLYISGGVMAAPTVGAVMADILPYLGVEKTAAGTEAAAQTVTLADYTGMTAKEAEKALSAEGLSSRSVGIGETVTGQLPAAGQTVPGESQILLYFSEDVENTSVAVPDFTGMTRQQASDAAGLLGLYVLVTGNTEVSPSVTVCAQSAAAGTEVETGTTIKLTFIDTQAAD